MERCLITTRILGALMVTALMGCLPTTAPQVTSVPEADGGQGVGSLKWKSLDGDGADGINFNPQSHAQFPQIISMNSKLYSIWQETNLSTGILVIRAAVYLENLATWALVSPSAGLNKVSSKDGTTPHLITFNSKLYAIWTERYINTPQVRVAVYGGNDNSPSWAFVDGNGILGINKNSALGGGTPSLFTSNAKLYATWLEYAVAGNQLQIRVAVYNGSDNAPAWTFVDGNGPLGLNKDTTQNATHPYCVDANSKLYCTWAETSAAGRYQIRVRTYNGNDSSPVWTFIDGNSATGLNFDSTQSAVNPKLQYFNSKLYLTWHEYTSTTEQIRVAVYNGNDNAPAWQFIDGGGATGINNNSARRATSPTFLEHSGKLLVVWAEDNTVYAGNGDMGRMSQIRVATNSGTDALPNWIFYEDKTDVGINRDISQHAEYPQTCSVDSKSFIIWSETNAQGILQIRIKSRAW